MKRAMVKGFLGVWLSFCAVGLLTLLFPGPLGRQSTQDILLRLLIIPFAAVVPGIIGAGVAAAFYRYRRGPFSAEKTDEQLQEVVANPSASPEAVDAARAELQKRGIAVVVVPQKGAPDRDYEILPNGRRRYLRATPTDIVSSVILPPWGIIVGVIALFLKGEKKRGKTMIVVGGCVFLFLIIALLSERPGH